MPARPEPTLFSSEGELVFLRISVEPRLLEDLLEALAQLSFPVNPQLYHRPAQVVVEFPAYLDRLEEVRHALSHCVNADNLEVNRVLGATAGC